MRVRRGILRPMVVLTAAALVVGACSDDNDSAMTTAEEMAVSQGPATPEMESTDMESDTAPSGPVDCAAVEAAFDAVGSASDPSAGGDDPQRDFENARAAMVALKAEAPDIADDIDKTIEGLDALMAIYSEVGWETLAGNDPAAALAFVQAMSTNQAALLGITEGLLSVSLWVQENCT